jgi:hypothetical protein
MVPRNHDAGNDAESDLRNEEPEPVDPLIENGIEYIEDAVDQAGPQNGSNDTSQQNGTARKHRKRRAIEKPDEYRTDQVENGSDDQSVPMESRDLRDGRSGWKESCR